MFAARYYTGRMFAPRYFVKVGDTVLVTRFVSLTLGARTGHAIEAAPALSVSPRTTLEVA
jgi:hypothetical protein